METRWIPVGNGIGLAVDAWTPPRGAGTGATCVLVHGLASNARMWDGVAVRLAASGHGVLAVDLRGHGRSSKPDGPYDVPSVAADLAALVDVLGLERPIVAGQSWGGNVVLELAAAHPGLARGVVCVDGGWLDLAATYADWDACAAALAPPRLAGLRRDAVEAHIREAHPDWPESGIAGILGNFEQRADGTVAPWLTFERHMLILRGLWEHRPADRYPAIATPVLLVPADTGDETRAPAKREAVDAALAALPRARASWIAGEHDIHAQRPDEVASLVLGAVADGFFA